MLCLTKTKKPQDKHPPPMIVQSCFRLQPVRVMHCYALIRCNLICYLVLHAPLPYPILLQLRIFGKYCKCLVLQSFVLAVFFLAFPSTEYSFWESITLDSQVNFRPILSFFTTKLDPIISPASPLYCHALAYYSSPIPPPALCPLAYFNESLAN